MQIAVIYGTMHKGSTYHIAQLFLNNLADENTTVHEFFLPSDMPEFCTGCFACILKGEENCPHYQKLQPIASALEEADFIILASPVYVFSVSGQLKSLLDHFGYIWMSHRPRKQMFHKVGLALTTAAGAGTKKAVTVMKDSLLYWGVAKIYAYGKNVNAKCWEEVDSAIKQKIEKEVKKLSDKIKKSILHAKPTLKTKVLFSIMRLMQKSNTWNVKDKSYWEEHGWLQNIRPW